MGKGDVNGIGWFFPKKPILKAQVSGLILRQQTSPVAQEQCAPPLIQTQLITWLAVLRAAYSGYVLRTSV